MNYEFTKIQLDSVKNLLESFKILQPSLKKKPRRQKKEKGNQDVIKNVWYPNPFLPYNISTCYF